MNPIGGDGNNNNNINNNNHNNNNNAAIVNAFFQVFEPLEFGDRAEYGGGFEFRGGGVSTSLLPVSTKDYLLSLVGDSLWLNPPDIQYLITRRVLELTPSLPVHPQPPVLLMVPSTLVVNGLEDGYAWQQTRSFDHTINSGVSVTIINVACSYRNVAGYPRMYRRIYRLVGHNDVLIVHYKYEMVDRLTRRRY